MSFRVFRGGLPFPPPRRPWLPVVPSCGHERPCVPSNLLTFSPGGRDFLRPGGVARTVRRSAPPARRCTFSIIVGRKEGKGRGCPSAAPMDCIALARFTHTHSLTWHAAQPKDPPPSSPLCSFPPRAGQTRRAGRVNALVSPFPPRAGGTLALSENRFQMRPVSPARWGTLCVLCVFVVVSPPSPAQGGLRLHLKTVFRCARLPPRARETLRVFSWVTWSPPLSPAAPPMAADRVPHAAINASA